MKSIIPNMTFGELKNPVLACIKANTAPVILGDAGIGKSSFIKALAEQDLNTKCFVLKVNALAGREDLSGQRLIPMNDAKTEYAMKFFPQLKIMDAVHYAKENPDKDVLLFLDELNRTTPDVMSAVFQFITEREVGDVALPDNVKIIAAGNDTGNVTAPDDAAVNRFIVLRAIPDIETYLRVNPTLNPYIKQFLSANPDYLYEGPANFDSLANVGGDDDDDNYLDLDDTEGVFNQYASPRSWTNLSKFLNAAGFTGDNDMAEQNSFDNYTVTLSSDNSLTLLDATIDGHLGQTAAGDEFKTFMNNKSQVVAVTAAANSGQQLTGDTAGPLIYLDELANKQAFASMNSSQREAHNIINKPIEVRGQTLEAKDIVMTAFSTLADDLTNINNLREALMTIEDQKHVVDNGLTSIFAKNKVTLSTNVRDLIDNLNTVTAKRLNDILATIENY